MKPPPVLDAIAEKVLGYRPKAAKAKLRKKAKRKLPKKQKVTK
jgi:hypothetical protein